VLATKTSLLFASAKIQKLAKSTTTKEEFTIYDELKTNVDRKHDFLSA
jgi:hypothetical protein